MPHMSLADCSTVLNATAALQQTVFEGGLSLATATEFCFMKHNSALTTETSVASASSLLRLSSGSIQALLLSVSSGSL